MFICSPLRVTAMTRNADGEQWGRLLEFEDPDHRPHHWACPMELLASDGVEFRRVLASMGLIMAGGARARQHLMLYLQSAHVDTRAVCTDRTGWHGGVDVLPTTLLAPQTSAYCCKRWANRPACGRRGPRKPGVTRAALAVLQAHHGRMRLFRRSTPGTDRR